MQSHVVENNIMMCSFTSFDEENGEVLRLSRSSGNESQLWEWPEAPQAEVSRSDARPSLCNMTQSSSDQRSDSLTRRHEVRCEARVLA